MPRQANINRKEDFTDYIQSLENRLIESQAEQQAITIRYNDLNMEKTLTSEKLAFLKLCYEKIAHTNELAKRVIYVLANNQSLVRRTACNAELTRRAITKMVSNAESIAFKILELQTCLEALIDAIIESDCNPQEDGSIMQAINSLQVAITAAYEAACQCITKLLEALQRAVVLENYIGDQECNTGLAGTIFQMLKIIHIRFHSGSKIHFPRERCPMDFYEDSQAAYTVTQRKLRDIETQLEQVEEEKCLIDAEVLSIGTSKAAAEAASNC